MREQELRGRALVVTADDFGLDQAVNQAVEQGHREGILTSASLMVAAPAAADAVERARRLPSLAVGLHVVLVCGRPLLPPGQVPALVGPDGRFLDDLGAAGVRFFFHPGARAQLEAELTAQFEAFRATGLALDHADAHNHIHVHPTVLGLMLKVGRRFGLKAVRLPREAGGLGAAAIAPWIALMRARLRRAGMVCNDYILGMSQTGHLTPATVLELLARPLPPGLLELYFHPASQRTPPLVAAMPDYDHEGELAALVSPEVRARLGELGLHPRPFSAL